MSDISELLPWRAPGAPVPAAPVDLAALQLVPLTEGGFLTAWAEASGAIRAQVRDAAGAPLGPVLTLDAGADPATALALAQGGGGAALAAWVAATPSGPVLRLARFDAAGTRLAETAPMPLSGEGAQTVSLAVNAAGEVYVAWALSGGTKDTVRGRLFDAGLAPLSPERELQRDDDPRVEAIKAWQPDVTALPSGQFAATLAESASDMGIKTLTVHSSAHPFAAGWGAVAGRANVPVTGADGLTQHDPQIVALASGEAAAVWGATDPTGVERLECIVLVAGGATIRIQAPVAGGRAELLSPRIAALPDGGFAIACVDSFAGTVEIRAYGPDGAEGPARTVASLAGVAADPDLTALPDGRLALGWRDAADGLLRRALLDPRPAGETAESPAAGGAAFAGAAGVAVPGGAGDDALYGADDIYAGGGADALDRLRNRGADLRP